MSRSRRSTAFAAVSLLATVLLAQEASGYIRVQDGVFVDEQCKEFMFSGYNAWETIEAALNLCCGNLVGLRSQFKEAVRQNFNVIRIFGFPVQKGFNLQVRPGQYNEQAFVGMDTVIAEAGKAGLKLIIALTNNWNYNTLQTDWKCAYTNWTTTARGCDDFFTDPNTIQLYKNHVQKVLTRVNTVNHIAYQNDSTILGWNLMNEPRSAKDSGIADIQSWINTVAPFVKSLAGHQLLTVGEDGFYGPTTCQAWNGASPFLKNGQDQWPLHTGQDFLPNHMVDGIDFASLHLWPDNWARTDEYFGRKWLDTHLKDQWYMGKPVVIEEFGKAIGIQGGWMAQLDQTYTDQYNWFKLVYKYAQQSLTSDYGYKGIMFWRWASVDPTASAGGFDEAATISTNSTIFTDIIEPYSKNLAAWLHNSNRKPIANCKPLTGNGTMDMPSALPPAPGPDAFIPLLGGAPAPGALPGAIVAPGAIIAPAGVPAVAPLAAPVDVARTPISAPVNLTPGTLVNPEPGNPIVASAGAPIAAPAKIAAQPAGLGVPVVAPGGVPVVNAPAGTPIIPVQSAVVPGTITAGTPAIAPAAYVWAGANATGPGATAATAGRKLMQSSQSAASHAARVADAPLSAAVLAPLLAPATSPEAAKGAAVAAAVISAETAPAPALGVASSQPMSAVLSITAPMAAEATVISDLQEEPFASNKPAASSGPAGGANAARRAGVDSFQQRGGGGGGGGPGGGGPGGRGPPDGPPLPLPGPFLPGPGDNSANSDGAASAATPTQSQSQGQGQSQGQSQSQSQSSAQQNQPVVEPFSSPTFTTESTFSTPSGINGNNINSKVTCT
ncbi:g6902 [Coccomyxa viridis]|uniref:mannan endo-1,4-beta-mannosidase n=1 Tax=Coccomyxa viridis TaxID=1274662 RepID=A0ABP1FYV1_9CHLO